MLKDLLRFFRNIWRGPGPLVARCIVSPEHFDPLPGHCPVCGTQGEGLPELQTVDLLRCPYCSLLFTK